MRRVVRALIVSIGWIAALTFGFALAVFFWAFSALRSDLAPPDPSPVPPTILSLLRVDAGNDASGLAARFLIEHDPTMSQLRYTLASLMARSWIRYRWTEDEALAEIALESYFGQGFYGVQEAAHGYFGVPADALTVSQAASLVAITWAPSSLSPWCHPDRNAERVKELLASLPDRGNVGASLEGLLAPTAGACTRERS